MRVLVTGSTGHLGEALMRTFREDHAQRENEAVGTDILPSQFTQLVGTITDREHVKRCLEGVDVVLHTATLHKPHVATHRMQEFVDTNISGTLELLDAAVQSGVKAFVFTSTTSSSDARSLRPRASRQPG